MNVLQKTNDSFLLLSQTIFVGMTSQMAVKKILVLMGF
jgi:hypothetical protein